MVDTYVYTAYGVPGPTTGTDRNPFRYGGQVGYYTDPASCAGLILCGARWYSPDLGRWISRDPSGYDGGPNLYDYCLGRPAGFVDPFGNSPFDWKKMGGELVFGLIGGGLGSLTANPAGAKLGYALGVGIFDGLYAYFVEGRSAGAAMLDAAIGAGLSLLGPALLHKLGARIAATSWGRQLIAKATTCSAGDGALMRALTRLGIRTCFVAGTPVQVIGPDGKIITKPIEQVRAGDLVMSRDEETGKTEPKRVTKAFQRQAPTVLTVTLADASTGKTVETITGTPEHPIYVKGKGFVPLGELGVGSQIVTRAGPGLVVKSVVPATDPRGFTVYNLVVEGNHSYFVGAANGGAWVHNGDCMAETLIRDHYAKLQSILARRGSQFGCPGNVTDGSVRSFASYIEGHVAHAAEVWQTTYHGVGVHAHIDGGVVVMTDVNGTFISAWRATAAQLSFYRTGVRIR